MVKAGEHELSGKKSNRASNCGLMCNVTLSTVSQVCGLVLLRQWAPYWWCVSGILFRCCVFKSCLSPAKMLQTILPRCAGSLNASEQSPRSPTVYDESVHTWLKQERTGITICPPNSSIFDMCVVVFDVWIEYQLQQSYYFALHHELLWS